MAAHTEDGDDIQLLYCSHCGLYYSEDVELKAFEGTLTINDNLNENLHDERNTVCGSLVYLHLALENMSKAEAALQTMFPRDEEKTDV